MKKLFLVLLVGLLGISAFFPISQARAQEGLPEVLAAVAHRPTSLPKIVADKNVVVKETVDQDLVTAGGDVAVDSVVNGNLFGVGGTVKVGGTVSEDIVYVGGDITLGGEVKKNVIVVGGNVSIPAESHVGGYLLVVGGQVDLSGKVDGDVKLVGGQVTVNDSSVVGGNLSINGGKILVSDKAMVSGKKEVVEMKRLDNASNSASMAATRQKIQGFLPGIIAAFSIVGFIGKLILGLALVRLFGTHIGEITKIVSKSFWSTLGWGFAKLFLTPILIIVLMITVIGWPVSILVGFVYAGAIFLSGFISAAVLGHWIHLQGWLKSTNLYLQMVLGLALFEIVGFIPFVGGLVKFAGLLIGLGVVIAWEKSLLKSKS